MEPSARAGPAITPAGFLVMIGLASGQKHGYAIMTFVEELTAGEVRLGPGTLYRTLQRLVVEGLVTESGSRDRDAPHDARRRYYRLTRAGVRAAKQEAARLARLVDAAADAGMLETPPRRTGRRGAGTPAARGRG